MIIKIIEWEKSKGSNKKIQKKRERVLCICSEDTYISIYHTWCYVYVLKTHIYLFILYLVLCICSEDTYISIYPILGAMYMF